MNVCPFREDLSITFVFFPKNSEAGNPVHVLFSLWLYS